MQEREQERQQAPQQAPEQQVQHQQPQKSEVDMLKEEKDELIRENRQLQLALQRAQADQAEEQAEDDPESTPVIDQADTEKRASPAVVTRVVADLMIFVSAEIDKEAFGLVFKPNKIKDYLGEPLKDLGIVEGAIIPRIEWVTDIANDASRVISVTIHRTHHESSAMRAG